MTGTRDAPSTVVAATVLLVASKERDAARLACELEDRGLGVLLPDAVLEALAFASAARPGLVLLDLRMPDAGVLCRRLREDARCGRPAIMLLVPHGVTPVSATVWGEDVELLEWDVDDPGAAADRAVAAAIRQRGLRAASPLTGLPGNEAIRAELDRRLASGEPVSLLYADLDGFKAYNDRYGFLRGDRVIRALADLLVAESRRCASAFVGHIGGDDFVMLLPPEDAEAAAHRVATAFDALVPHMYDPADAARGWISERDRLGRRRRWPLVSVSIGLARSDRRAVRDALELVDVATEMKRVAKRVRGSAVAADRRQQGAGRPVMRALGGALLGPARRLATVAVAVAVAALVFVPAGSALAAARPGDVLWPAARLFEDVRVAMADSETAVALHLQLAGDRLADVIVALDTDDDEAVAESLAEFRRHNEGALGNLGMVNASERPAKLAQVQDARARQAAVLSGLVLARCGAAGEVLPGACVALREALEVVGPAGVQVDAAAPPPGTATEAGTGPAPDGSPPTTRAPSDDTPGSRDGTAPLPHGTGGRPGGDSGAPTAGAGGRAHESTLPASPPVTSTDPGGQRGEGIAPPPIGDGTGLPAPPGGDGATGDESRGGQPGDGGAPAPIVPPVPPAPEPDGQDPLQDGPGAGVERDRDGARGRSEALPAPAEERPGADAPLGGRTADGLQEDGARAAPCSPALPEAAESGLEDAPGLEHAPGLLTCPERPLPGAAPSGDA